jgi:hypothetical protein
MPKNLSPSAYLWPQSFPLPQSDSFTDTYWLIQNYLLRDTSAHDNTTSTGGVPDCGTLASPGPFFILPVADEVSAVESYAVWFYNGTNQAITAAQVLGNVVLDKSFPNFVPPGVASVAVASLAAEWVPLSYSVTPLEYVVAQVTATVAPTKGTVQAILFVNHYH